MKGGGPDASPGGLDAGEGLLRVLGSWGFCFYFLGYACLTADPSGLIGVFFLAADEPFSCCGSFSHCGYSVWCHGTMGLFGRLIFYPWGVRTMGVCG